MVDATSHSMPDDLREMIEAAVEDAVDRRLRDLLGDPDEGLVVRDELVKRLQEQHERVEEGDLGRPMEEVMKELGLQ